MKYRLEVKKKLGWKKFDKMIFNTLGVIIKDS